MSLLLWLFFGFEKYQYPIYQEIDIIIFIETTIMKTISGCKINHVNENQIQSPVSVPAITFRCWRIFGNHIQFSAGNAQPSSFWFIIKFCINWNMPVAFLWFLLPQLPYYISFFSLHYFFNFRFINRYNLICIHAPPFLKQGAYLNNNRTRRGHVKHWTTSIRETEAYLKFGRQGFQC